MNVNQQKAAIAALELSDAMRHLGVKAWRRALVRCAVDLYARYRYQQERKAAG